MVPKVFQLLFLISPIMCELVVPIQNSMMVQSQSDRVLPNECSNSSSQFISNPRGCSWFWQCKDNSGLLLDTPIEGKCPDNLHFINNTCTYPDGSCNYDDEIIKNTQFECYKNTMSLIPHETNCSLYYLCFKGQKSQFECPNDEHFSWFQNGCVNEKLADCRIEDTFCRQLKTRGKTIQRSRTSCEDYHACYECENSYKTLAFQCHNTTHQFSEEYGHCDLKENVNCTVPSENPVVPEPPKPLSIICTEDDIRDHDVPHPNDDQYYFNCISGRSVLYRCPDGYMFGEFECVPRPSTLLNL